VLKAVMASLAAGWSAGGRWRTGSPPLDLSWSPPHTCRHGGCGLSLRKAPWGTPRRASYHPAAADHRQWRSAWELRCFSDSGHIVGRGLSSVTAAWGGSTGVLRWGHARPALRLGLDHRTRAGWRGSWPIARARP